MKITSISIERVNNCNRLLASVNIVIDNSLLITNIKLLHNGVKMFIEFPSKNNAYPDIIPLKKEVRNFIEQQIISQYLQITKVG